MESSNYRESLQRKPYWEKSVRVMERSNNRGSDYRWSTVYFSVFSLMFPLKLLSIIQTDLIHVIEK